MERKEKRRNGQPTCARCGGLLISDLFMELVSSPEVPAQRCVQCGEVLDPVILRNRQLDRQSPALSAMSIGRMIQPGLLAAVLTVTGCSTDLAHSVNGQPALKPVNIVSQEQARQLAFTYRRQATDLHELAQRMEYEAKWNSGQLRANQEASIRRQLQSKNVLSAAEDADELARAYQRQIPHGQMQ